MRLIWDRHSPGLHHCPIDHASFAGEPYDGAWWRWLNGLNAKACYELAVLWLLTNEPHYLSKVRDILMQYAKYYPDYQEHGGIPYNGQVKLTPRHYARPTVIQILQGVLTLSEQR